MSSIGSIATNSCCDQSHVIVQELQSKLQMKQAFVQYVSHEIRTPLQMISAGLALLKDDLKDKLSLTEAEGSLAVPITSPRQHKDSVQTDFKTRVSINSTATSTTAETTEVRLSFASDELRQDLELVEIMHDSTLTAVSILNDLLLYEKVESNMLVIEQRSVHLFDTIVPAVKMFTIQASYAKVTLTWDLDSLINVYALLDISKFRSGLTQPHI